MQRKTSNILILLTIITLVASCAATDVRTDAIKGSVNLVMDRLDAYVQADTALDEAQKAQILVDTQLARSTVAASDVVDANEFKPLLYPLLDRHDGYVLIHESTPEKETYLRTSSLLWRVFDEAASP